jgi:hypothetical protein
MGDSDAFTAPTRLVLSEFLLSDLCTIVLQYVGRSVMFLFGPLLSVCLGLRVPISNASCV